MVIKPAVTRHMYASHLSSVCTREKSKAHESLDACGHVQDIMFYVYSIENIVAPLGSLTYPF